MPKETVLAPAAIGGLTRWRTLDLDETGQLVSAGSHQLYGYYISNNATDPRYVKIYDHVNAPVSTDTPALTLAIPAGSAANLATPIGIAFASGIGLRATTAAEDNDVGAPGAYDVIVNVWYK